MRELHGVMFAGRPYIDMKRRALLFDKFLIWRYVGAEHERPAEFDAEVSFLKKIGIAVAPPLDANDFADATSHAVVSYAQQTIFAEPSHDQTKGIMVVANGVVIRDCDSRAIAAKVREKSDCDAAAICEIDLPTELLNVSDRKVVGGIVTVASEILPTPDDSCAWQDILDFKQEMKDKLWRFRRFLHSLAIKKQTEAEIRDDIEWSLNEYTKAMKLHNLKAGHSLVKVYVIPAIEVVEDIAKFNWSRIAKGAFSVTKRKIELMEAEMKAPGRECAYVFDARKRFEPR